VTTKTRWSTAACLVIVIILALCALAQPVADKKDRQKAEKPYALIFGTAYGPDDRPLYGVKIKIREQTKKHSNYEQMSDHRGEFAQRVPPGPSDYLVYGEGEYAPAGPDGKPQVSKKKKLRGKTKVHVDSQERIDISVHLTE
jgi:hypothetical protein